MRVAVVHDWLYTYGGAERVLKAIISCFPNDTVDVHCLFDVLNPEDKARIGYKNSKNSFLQRMPGIRKRHRLYLPFMPIAIEQLDLSSYDLIISSSYAVAKGVVTGPDQLHISYIHSPLRYAWDLQHQYLHESNKDKGISGFIARVLLHYIRMWDIRTAHGPNEMIANSNFIARRIKKIYGREATVIYPPVNVPSTPPEVLKQPSPMVNKLPSSKYFFTASRLVPYKNTHLIVEAFNKLPSEQLVVAGIGPELNRLKKMAGPNIHFAGFVSNADMKKLMEHAAAFVFAAEEDFGIIPIEAQGMGTPVIAYGRGGVRETIITTGLNPTGLFFNDLSAGAIVAAVEDFNDAQYRYTSTSCYANALRFSEERFKIQFSEYVALHVAQFQQKLQDTFAQPL